MDRQDLDEFIVDNLHELTWEKHYPLAPQIGVDCFLRAMRNAGFFVDIGQRPFIFFDTFEHQGKIWELKAEISEEEITEGWERSPASSPHSLYDSIYIVIDTMQQQIRDEFPEWRVPRDLSSKLSNTRWDKAHKILKLLEKYFLESFRRYHEGALLPLGAKGYKPLEPEILERLIKMDVINLERINQAVANTQFEGCLLTSVSDTIAFLKDGKGIDEGYNKFEDISMSVYRGISQSGAEDYIWGVYLLELAKQKKYPVKRYDREEVVFGNLEVACDIGWHILEDARFIKSES